MAGSSARLKVRMKYKKIRKIITKYFHWWASNMGLKYWDLTVQFSREIIPSGQGNNRTGLCEATWKYCTATLTFYPNAMQYMSEKEIELVVVHELAHCLVNEIGTLDDHEERVVSGMTKAFLWVRDAAMDKVTA